MQRVSQAIDALNEWIGRAVSWGTLFMVLATVVVVVMRRVFGTGSIALQESVTYLHALVFMFGAAYALKHDAHVRVDVFYHRWNVHRRAWVNLAGTVLLLFPVAALIFFSSLDYVAGSWRVLEASREPGGLPLVYLLKTMIPVAALLLALQGVAWVLQSIMTLRGRN